MTESVLVRRVQGTANAQMATSAAQASAAQEPARTTPIAMAMIDAISLKTQWSGSAKPADLDAV
jgi:hypothetical protein